LKNIVIILIVLFLSRCLFSPTIQTDNQIDNQIDSVFVAIVDTIRLVFAGDVMGHGMQITGAWRDGGDTCYNYYPSFQWVKDYILDFDIAVANLEVTLAGPPYSGYPDFSSHKSLADALLDAGFNVLLTANNHVLDRGKKGLERTLDVLDSIGMIHTGAFRDSIEWKENYPLLIEKNNFRLALLNYTYDTNCYLWEKPNIVNYIDTLRMANDLENAKSLNPDYIIVCVHWGDEYKNEENEKQRKIANFLARHGCNLIVGAHPHVVQPLVKMNDSAYVAYSLGNFISNQRNRYRDGGITLELTLTKTDSIVALQSIKYEPFWVYRYPKNGISVFRLIRINDYLEYTERYPIISEIDKMLMMRFYEDTKEIMISD